MNDGDGRDWFGLGYFPSHYWNIHYWNWVPEPYESPVPYIPTNPSMPWMKRRWWAQIWSKITHR